MVTSDSLTIPCVGNDRAATPRCRRWLLIATLMAGACRTSLAAVVPVADAAALRAAIDTATAGDEIVLAHGHYAFATNLDCDTAGTAEAPIIVRADVPGTALLAFGDNGLVSEGFKVSAPHWRFEGLDVLGTCADDSDCEHAFHLFGHADFTMIRGNRLRDFNAQIKSNGSMVGGQFVFPDDVLIEDNLFQDSRGRITANPVTKIDVVGGRRWILRGNTLIDFQKRLGNGISYGAFLKGHSRDGVFERNLVVCERAFGGGTRIGLSLGGGGTAPDSICEDGTCTPEHQGGAMRNNIVTNCSDVGIYLNNAAATTIEHNLLHATQGIDVRFPSSSADLRNNLLTGMIRNRDGGTHHQAGNLTGVSAATFDTWFAHPAHADFRRRAGNAVIDQGVASPGTTNDFCGDPRESGSPDVGAVEYAAGRVCDTTDGGGGMDRMFFGGFEG